MSRTGPRNPSRAGQENHATGWSDDRKPFVDIPPMLVPSSVCWCGEEHWTHPWPRGPLDDAVEDPS